MRLHAAGSTGKCVINAAFGQTDGRRSITKVAKCAKTSRAASRDPALCIIRPAAAWRFGNGAADSRRTRVWHKSSTAAWL